MQVSRWGNSLAIRIPADIVKALDLKPGDEVEMVVEGARKIELRRDDRRAQALDDIRSMQFDLPADWKFDREEANRR